MPTITCTLKVRPDGLIQFPQDLWSQLGIRPGDIVHVQVSTSVPSTDYAAAPLWQVLEECRTETGVPDLAEEHDHYAYGTRRRDRTDG